MRTAILLLAPLLLAQGPYVVGSERDPDRVDDRVVYIDVVLERQVRYTDRFAVETVAVSPDGKEIAAVTRASRVGPKAWEASTGKPVPMPPMSTAVSALGYAPGFTTVAASVIADVMSNDPSGLIEFDLKTGKPGRPMPEGEGARSVAYSPDGSVLALATSDGVLVGPSGGPLELIAPIPGGADAVTFSTPDTLNVVTQSGEAMLRMSLADGQVLETWNGPSGHRTACLSPDGRYAAFDAPGALAIHDLWGGKGVAQLEPSPAQITSCAWGSSGTMLVAGTDDGRVLFFALAGVRGVEQGSSQVVGSRGSRNDRAERGSRGSARAEPPSREPAGERDPFGNRRDDPGLQLGKRDGASTEQSEGSVQIVPRFAIAVFERFGGDPRTEGELLRGLEDYVKKLQPCWRKAARKGERVVGKLAVPMTISANGEGRGFGSPTVDEMGSRMLFECLEEKMRSPIFPAGLGSLEVELTIELREE